MACEKCGAELDYPYHMALCPACYAKVASTAERPEIGETALSRTLSFWACGLFFFSGATRPWFGPFALILHHFVLALAILAIAFHILGRRKVKAMDIPTHRFTRAGLVLGLYAGLVALLNIAVETRDFTRLPF